MASLEGQALDVLKSLFESDKPAALAAIQAAEGGIEGFIVNAIKNAQFTGIAGMLAKAFEPSLESGVAAYVASHGPEVVYEWIDALIAEEAKKLGG